MNISSAVGQAACGIVHDLSNLIQTIILRAEVTSATEPVSAACVKRMEQIVDDGQGGANVIRNLLEFARKSIEALEPSDAREIVLGAVTAYADETGIEIATESDEKPLFAKLDAPQINDLVTLVFNQLLAGTTNARKFSISVKHAKPEGEALSWMAEENWLEIRMVRDGAGCPVDLDEGNLFKSGTSAQTESNTMSLMRIRGIVRQHKGQLRVMEKVDDEQQSESVEVYLPLTQGNG